MTDQLKLDSAKAEQMARFESAYNAAGVKAENAVMLSNREYYRGVQDGLLAAMAEVIGITAAVAADIKDAGEADASPA